MSRTKSWLSLAIALAIVGLSWNSVAGGVPGACKPVKPWKPVKVCEAVKPLPPACQPVKKISPPLPTCGPVKACERVDGYVKHETLHERVATVLSAPKRLVAHHREHHGRYVETYETTPQQSAPSAAPKPAPAGVPQPLPPAPTPTKA
jgi:hypothetical protein